jgi:hypothetical protein
MATTVAFLSAGWVAELPVAYGGLPAREGASGVVQATVTGGPDGDVTWWTVHADGRVVAAGLGERPDATVTVTAPYPVAADLATGALAPSAAFMQGRAKVAGDQAALLWLLAATATPAYREATAELAGRTRVGAPAGG